MSRPLRSQQIPNLRESIKDAAWRQITGEGVSSLSLRKIARELHISAPAIYNYFPDRDALVTALIIDAYATFGDFQLLAKESYPHSGQIIERFRATGLAYRQWALDYPHRYLLIFGTPVPGYNPPIAEILPFMMRSLSALVSIIGELHHTGLLKVDAFPLFDVDACNRFFPVRDAVKPQELLVYSVAMLIWSRVHGLVSLEITGQLPPFGLDGGALYLYELDTILNQFVTV
jgi:AcrR family transcriptional regulator